MEVVSCKVLQSYYRIWSEDDNFLVEDVEVQRSLSMSEAQLSWFLEALSELLRDLKVIEVQGKEGLGVML